MQHDRQLTISTAGSRDALLWPPERTTWSELCERLRTPRKGAESHVEYLRLTKARQDALKDVGGFVGGVLKGNRRKIKAVTGRDLITLDLDAIPSGGAAEVLFDVDMLGCAACVYSTRKHDPDHPRLRVIIPLARTVTGEEYEPVARKVAETLGIAKCDPTCFRPNQMMYWPNVSCDSEYVYEVYDQPMLDPDTILASYTDWRNMAEWPKAPGQEEKTRSSAEKAEDPEAKQGGVGAFCRCYDIRRAMAELIPGAYEPTDDPGRFTYTGGSTTGGAIVYEGKWLYSHHATDPCSERLVNAWDMVRLHLYGEQDENAQENTPVNKLPSSRAMADMAMGLTDVRLRLAQERVSAAEDFTGDAGANWLAELDIDKNGRCVLNAKNLQLIFHNDPNLAGKFGYNTFRYAVTANDTVPWNERAKCPRDWTDPDDSSMRNYFDMRYGLVGKSRIDDMFVQVAQERPADDVRDYLDRLRWDGKPRVDDLLIRYLKADDTPYVRAVTRKTLVAAVARTMEPGCKFDNVLTLIGAQGIAKSMFVDILGGQWYNDSIQSFNGKDAQELLRGSWLIEIPEVDRFSTKYDSAVIKQFITRRDDIFRESYGHRTASHPRRCIFIATTNAAEFLLDATGNRRWWIVQCRATADDRGEDMESLRRDRDQVWAEAVSWYQLGEDLTLPPELHAAALEAQNKAQAEDAWLGMVREFLDKDVPADWAGYTLEQRQAWWADEFGQRTAANKVQRQTICVPEIWCELMGEDKSNLDRMKSQRIAVILRAAPGWEEVGPRKTVAYGCQKTYKRVKA